jgi:hypothetical protein
MLQLIVIIQLHNMVILTLHLHNTDTILTQYLHILTYTHTILTQYLHILAYTHTIVTLYLHNTYTILTQYLHYTYTILTRKPLPSNNLINNLKIPIYTTLT